MKSKACCLAVAALLLAVFVTGTGNVSAYQQQRPQRPQQRRLPEGVRMLQDIEYAKTADGKSLLLDLYLPEGTPERPLPLVIWVHGGAWLGGDKAQTPAIGLTRVGYAVASVNYRLSQEALFPAQIQDCKAAVRWLRAHAKEHHLDPERFGAWGSSAGGHLVALLGTAGHVKEWETVGENRDVSSRVQAVVDWFGPSDFLQMTKMPSRIDRTRADSPEALLIGGPLEQNKDKAAKANPITYIRKGNTPPFLIVHGDRDEIVPINQSELLHAALKKAGVNATYEVVEGAGHGFPGLDPIQKATRFFDLHLKQGGKADPDADKALVFVTDFESGIPDEWHREMGRDDAVTLVDAPVRAGKKAVRFDLNRDDPVVSNGKRAEINLPPEVHGLERWYGFSIFLPEEWEADRSPEIVAQWHELPDWHLNEDWRSPPLALLVRGDRWQIHRIWDRDPLTLRNTPGPNGGSVFDDLGPYKKGVWTDWVFHVKWTHEDSGLLEIWRDGEKVFTHNGPTMYNDRSGNYFKMGIYKWEWRSRPENSTTNRRTLYHDELRIGGPKAKYETVAPGGGKKAVVGGR